MHVVFLVRHSLRLARPHKIFRLKQELKGRGDTFSDIDFAELSVSFSSSGISVFWRGSILPVPDILYWAHEWRDQEAFVIMQALEDSGYPLFASPRMPMSDKVTQAFLFAQQGLPFPLTWVCTSTSPRLDVLPYPLVLKGRYGARGESVCWVANRDDVIRALSELAIPAYEPFVLQSPVYPLGEDVRAFVVGRTVVAAMIRHSSGGDFRANISLGAVGTQTVLSQDEERLVLEAHRLFQTPVSGVDFIRSAKGPVLLEVNMWPGLEGIEAATGVNVAAQMAAFMFDKVSINSRKD